jgi:hypothetical protein
MPQIIPQQPLSTKLVQTQALIRSPDLRLLKEVANLNLVN